MYTQELQSSALTLLLRTPNGRHGVGYNRYGPYVLYLQESYPFCAVVMHIYRLLCAKFGFTCIYKKKAELCQYFCCSVFVDISDVEFNRSELFNINFYCNHVEVFLSLTFSKYPNNLTGKNGF